MVHAAPLLVHVRALRGLWPGTVGLGRAGHVALTFDDGPDPAGTPGFLDLLERRSVRATFFLLGVMAERSPDLVRRLRDEGHEVAVHSWDHRSHLLRGLRGTQDQLARTAELLERLTGTRPTLQRPPYGHLTAGGVRAAREVGLTPVLWTSWGRDWEAAADPVSVARTVSRGRVDGGTVLLHDSDCTSSPGSWRATLGALPVLLDTWEEAGLRVGPLREHAAART